MAWQPTPDALRTAWDAALPTDDRVERRTMFGQPCAFVGGHMFTLLLEDRCVVRLGPGHRESLGRLGGLPFEPRPGQVMREYVVVPPTLVGDARRLRAWVLDGFRFAAALPPKATRRRAAITPLPKARPARA